jgi:hypothetical protein
MMSVYIDALHVTRSGKMWCHMMADTDAEMISMQTKLRLRPDWVHGDHFDLSPWKRSQAIKYGAIVVTSRDLVEIRRRKRNNGIHN